MKYLNLSMKPHRKFDLGDQKMLVLEVISRNPFIRAKKIFNISKKMCGGERFSYQYLFKLLSELVDAGVLTKTDLQYSINDAWLKERKITMEYLVARPASPVETVYSSEDLQITRFKCLWHLQKFWSYQFMVFASKLRERELYWKNPHCWWLIISPMDEENTIKEINSRGVTKSIGWITSDTCHDLDAAEYYKRRGRLVTVKKEKNDEVVEVYGDYIFYCKLPSELLSRMNKLYEKKSPNDDGEFSELMVSEADLELRIFRNKELAKAYREKIMDVTRKLNKRKLH